jgi:hypothetical protein
MFESNVARLIFLIGGIGIFTLILYLVITNLEIIHTLIDTLLKQRLIKM